MRSQDAGGQGGAKPPAGRSGRAGDSMEAELEGLLQVGVSLSVISDRQKMLDMILAEARKLAGAEGGSLYVMAEGRLTFVAAQNDRLSLDHVKACFLGKEVPLVRNSLAGFVATTGRTVNIPDADSMDPEAPFHINRDFDRASGYRTRSALAVPLKCPGGQCVGVLQLLNHVRDDGTVGPFPDAEQSGILSLASMAAITIQNDLLREQVKQAHLDTIIRLSVAAEFRDRETSDHIRRVSHTSALVARAMGLPERQVELIECASPMHDIGKIGIPDAVLRKEGPLTPDERDAIERHTTIGAEILGRPRDELLATAHDVALTHHERWDGHGYPHGIAGEAIPVAGRIVALADVFDALVSKRCYKRAYPVGTALDIIRRDEGKRFDPAVVSAFLSVLDEVVEAYGLAAAPATVGAAG